MPSLNDSYSNAREALNKRVGRLEAKGYIFPADVLDNLDIDEMNNLRGDSLKKIAEDFMDDIKEGNVSSTSEARTGYKNSIEEEDLADTIEGNQDLPEPEPEQESDPDYGYEEDDYGDYDGGTYDENPDYGYDQESYDYTYGDDLIIDSLRVNFESSSPEIVSLVDAFIKEAVAQYGQTAVSAGIEQAYADFGSEFSRLNASYDLSGTAAYLQKVLDKIESEYQLLSSFNNHSEEQMQEKKSVINDIIKDFVDAVENDEDWTEVY